MTEDQCKQYNRYLLTDSYDSEATTKIWQDECIKRHLNKIKSLAYEKFISWRRQENEIAVFTLYAYANFKIPKYFDCIFNIDNPKEYVEESYQLTQSIWEGWAPIDSIEHIHKHLCILTFDKIVPDIFSRLHQEKEKFSTIPKGSFKLGLCSFSNLQAITDRWAKETDLRNRYGEKWHEFDDGE